MGDESGGASARPFEICVRIFPSNDGKQIEEQTRRDLQTTWSCVKTHDGDLPIGHLGMS